MQRQQIELIAQVSDAFSQVTRPYSRLTPCPCEECDSLHNTLKNFNCDELMTLDTVQIFGHSHLHLFSADAIQYYFPAMITAALTATGDIEEFFIDDFLYFLAYGDGEKLSLLNDKQWQCLDKFLQFIREYRYEIVEIYGCEEKLENAISRWNPQY